MSEPTPGPTDADVEAMAIGMALNAPWEDAHKRWKDVPEHEKVVLRAGARAALMALPHYLRAVEEREGLIEALEAYEREREDMEDRAPTYPECIECNLGTGPHKRTCAHHLARAILSRAKVPTPEASPAAGEGETK